MSKQHLYLAVLSLSLSLYYIIIRRHTRTLRTDTDKAMAFFNSGSRALVEILTRMQRCVEV
jgi:hypothetical protein